jgi:hypothetical protein
MMAFLMLIINSPCFCIKVEGIGFSGMLSLAQTIEIVGTMILTSYFSKRQMKNL